MNIKVYICLIIALTWNQVSLAYESKGLELILTKYIDKLINSRHNGISSSSSSSSHHSEGIIKQKNDSSVPLPSSSYFINELFNYTDTISIKGK